MTKNLYLKKHQKEERREFEERTTLSQLSEQSVKEKAFTFKESFTASSEDIKQSGALPESKIAKKAQLDKTKAKRMQAYLSMDSQSVADTRGWRIRAAYRMITYMARITGDLVGPMTLDSLANNKYKPDPLTVP